ncbi:MAG: hypothetical protein KBH12_10095 [Synergistaceae bacterium]|nr:hypothetical protein [Synergistaceae bacterium]
MQFYRKSKCSPMFFREERYQNAGLAKNYEYDTVIVGTSMTQNFRSSYIDNKLNTKSLRLSMAGGTIHEQFLTVDLAVRNNENLKKIIWVLEMHSLMTGKGEFHKTADFPLYLYENKIYKELKSYLFSSYFGMKSLQNFIGMYPKLSLDTLNNWQDQYSFTNDKAMSGYLAKQKVFPEITAKMKNNFVSNLDFYVTRRINPSISYIFIFPPYSFLDYYGNKGKIDIAVYDLWLKAKEDLFVEMKKRKNVRIYDFQDAYEIIYDLNNYKDTTHYSQDINDWMIDRIAAEDGRYLVSSLDRYKKRNQHFMRVLRLTPDFTSISSQGNIEEYLARFRTDVAGASSKDILYTVSSDLPR